MQKKGRKVKEFFLKKNTHETNNNVAILNPTIKNNFKSKWTNFPNQRTLGGWMDKIIWQVLAAYKALIEVYGNT